MKTPDREPSFDIGPWDLETVLSEMEDYEPGSIEAILVVPDASLPLSYRAFVWEKKVPWLAGKIARGEIGKPTNLGAPPEVQDAALAVMAETFPELPAYRASLATRCASCQVPEPEAPFGPGGKDGPRLFESRAGLVCYPCLNKLWRAEP